MKLNKDLSKTATQWAQHLASIKTLKHSQAKFKDQPMGENLAYKFSSNKEGYAGIYTALPSFLR